MILELEDWRFEIDREATRRRTDRNAQDHCRCGYCRNYYETAAATYPQMEAFLAEFGVNLNGPSELMPFEPTLLLACYRVQGRILTWGKAFLTVDGVSVQPEWSDGDAFLLWVGEMRLPWTQEEPEEDVISPANLPDFLERTRDVWKLRHEEVAFCS